MIDIPSKNKLLKKAESIGNELLKVADRLNDGSITWGRGADLNLQPVYDSGIFNGRCGEGLFFGALYNATNDRKFKKASIQCFRGLQKNLGNAGYRENLIQRLGLGLAGVGGILYSLVRTSEFIGEYSMVKDAENVTASVTATHIKKDNLLEIIRGTAGLIPGLLALSDKGCEQALRTARICGSHLLERRVTDPVTKRKAWAVQRYIPESGFAHGSSGIAHSLQQLYKRIGELRFYDATMEAFSFEQSIFRENDLNWPDFRNQKKIKMCSWCRGATGIGFSRLSALDIIKEPDESNIAMDLMNALNKTNSLSPHQTDNLCCGNFGRIDFLFEAGKRLSNMTLKQAALKKAWACFDDSNDTLQFKLPSVNPYKPHLAPGFWKGHAGIGYSLLRLADLKSFPCVLMME